MSMNRSMYKLDSENQMALDRDDALHKIAVQILNQSKEALQECRLQMAQYRRDKTAGIESSVNLTTVWEKLDSQVVTPLEEFQQRLNLAVDIVRVVYEAQVSMILGAANQSNSGLQSKIEQIKAKQEMVTSRLTAISENLDAELSMSASVLAYASYKTRGMTSGEKDYSEELNKWSNVASRLEASVESLGSIRVDRIYAPVSVDNQVTTKSPSAKTSNIRLLLSKNKQIPSTKQDVMKDSQSFQLKSPEGRNTNGLNVFSTHTPFLTPVRHNGDTSDIFSPVSFGSAKMDSTVKPQNRMSSWSFQNMSSTPRRGDISTSGKPSNKIWSSPIGTTPKRRQSTQEDNESEPAKKMFDTDAASYNNTSASNSALIEKLGRQVINDSISFLHPNMNRVMTLNI